jgi:hypothetical protein
VANQTSEKRRRRRAETDRQRLYGISPEMYHQLLIDQAGLCAICDKPMISQRSPHVDHNHSNAALRGLLCSKCNNGLHFFENAVFMDRARAYIEEHSETSKTVLYPPRHGLMFHI